MKASAKLIAYLKQAEGLRLYAYRDSVGVPTIGYGHIKNVRMGQAITLQQAEKFLLDDLASVETFVNNLNVCKTQGQFDALVDFAYNLGSGKLLSSTLIKKIRAKAPTSEIQAQFKRWVYAGGKPLQGLVKRRAWEAQRWAE